MITVAATVRNEAGIHCRPSAAIIKEASGYPGQITVRTRGGMCDLKSIMGLLGLELGRGQKLKITVEGPREKSFAAKLKKLFETRFDFPPREPGKTASDLIAAARRGASKSRA